MKQSNGEQNGSASDETLAVCAAGGCRDSFEQLVLRFQVPLLHFLGHRCPTHEDAEDLVQEAFVRAHDNLHRYDNKWRFSTWLFTIANRLSINEFRRVRRRTESEVTRLPEESLLDSTAEPAAFMAAGEENGRLWRIVSEELGEPKFTAFWLFYAEGLSVKEIAQVLGRSRVAIKALMLRARRQLRPVLVSRLQLRVEPTKPSAESVPPHKKNVLPEGSGVSS